MSSPFKLFLQRWQKGCGNAICPMARNICHLRGDVPADICFVGEAPGSSEDDLGAPFVGPAGHLIDRIVKRAVSNFEYEDPSWGEVSKIGSSPTWKARVCFINVVGCAPQECYDDGEVMERNGQEPTADEIKQCIPRTSQLLEMVNPRLLVAVGRISHQWLGSAKRLKQVSRWCFERTQAGLMGYTSIMHPAAILRSPVAAQAQQERRCVVVLQSAIERMLGIGVKETDHASAPQSDEPEEYGAASPQPGTSALDHSVNWTDKYDPKYDRYSSEFFLGDDDEIPF